MKAVIFSALTALMLSGCFETVVVRKEPYPVYVSIPTVHAPPEVSQCTYMVDQLKDTDDPGTVAQAYKHDTECLRTKIRQYETILQQYSTDAEASKKVEQEIKQKFESVLQQYKAELEQLDNKAKQTPQR
jgi:ElaB/YqjD/DUF883 family membrane-anchored ribosome-binding protein